VAGLAGPGRIGVGGQAGGDRRAGDGPVAQRPADPRGQGRLGDQEAQPRAGQAIELAERAQDDQPLVTRRAGQGRDRQGRIDIDEGLVDQQRPSVRSTTWSGDRTRPLGLSGLTSTRRSAAGSSGSVSSAPAASQASAWPP
jgi:hypothetical protein